MLVLAGERGLRMWRHYGIRHKNLKIKNFRLWVTMPVHQAGNPIFKYRPSAGRRGLNSALRDDKDGRRVMRG
jgi:hypothetical protein